MRPRLAIVALLACLAAACGSVRSYGVDPRELLATNQSQAAARVAAARGVTDALERNTCEAITAIESVASDNDPQLATALDRLQGIATELCDAGVMRVDTTTDEFGSPSIQPPASGVISSGIHHFVFSADATVALGEVRSDRSVTENLEMHDEGTCLGIGDNDTDAIVHLLGDQPVTVSLNDPNAVIAATNWDGGFVCGSESDVPGSITLAPHGGPWDVFVGSVSGEPYSAQLQIAPGTSSIQGFRWEFGVQGTFRYSIGPYTESASTISSSCYGHVSVEPQMRFTPAGEGYGYIEVDGTGDSVLIVRDATGQVWCNDDSVGLNPALDLYVGTGPYELWIGTYSIGTEMDVGVTFY